MDEEALQLRMAAEVERLHAEAEEVRRRNAEALARRHREQAEAKQQRDAQIRELYSNRLDERKYFGQFGTSHR